MSDTTDRRGNPHLVLRRKAGESELCVSSIEQLDQILKVAGTKKVTETRTCLEGISQVLTTPVLSATFKPKIVGGRPHSLSLPFPYPSFPFLFPSPSSFALDVGPLSPARGPKLPQWGLGRSLTEIEFSAFYMRSGGNDFNDFPETNSTGHRITKNNRLINLDKTPGVGVRFARLGGFSPT